MLKYNFIIKYNLSIDKNYFLIYNKILVIIISKGAFMDNKKKK